MQPRPTLETPGRRRPRAAGAVQSRANSTPTPSECAVACGEPFEGSLRGNFGATEILIILVVIVLLFGSTRLPGIARGTGKHLRKTKDSVGTFKDEFESGMREIDPVTPIKRPCATPSRPDRGAEGRED